MKNLESQLNKETLQEKDSKSTIRVINAQFQKFIHSEVLKSSNYDSDDREVRTDFKQYTHMEVQSSKDLILQHMNFSPPVTFPLPVQFWECDMNSIEQCIFERACHEQENHNRLIRLNERKLQIQECKVQEVKASDASLGDKESSGDDTDVRPSYDTEPMAEVPYTAEYNVFAVETQHSEQPENMNDTSLMKKVDSNIT
ncbi:hypothetical protein Tco_0099728, partial [Tanacetum coccineum]